MDIGGKSELEQYEDNLEQQQQNDTEKGASADLENKPEEEEGMLCWKEEKELVTFSIVFSLQFTQV